MALASRSPETDDALVERAYATARAAYKPTPGDYDVTVSLARARGIDPHDVAMLEEWESGFDPTRADPAGTGGGVNQMDASNLATMGIAPAAWLGMTIAEQQPHVFAFWDGLAKTYGGGAFPRDGANLYALNFLPGRYLQNGALSNPNAPLATKGAVDGHDQNGKPISYYSSNTNLDPNGTGSITVNTIASRLALVRAQAASQPILAGIDAALARSGGTPPATSGGTPPATSGGTPVASGSSPATRRSGGLGLAIFVAAAVFAFVRSPST